MFKGLQDSILYILRYPQFLYALWKLSRIRKPIITVFGGRNVPTYHKYYTMAYELSKKLAKHKVSLITGGGPGIMDAALCGAQEFDGGKNCLGIAVLGVDEYFSSACKAPSVFLPNFALRKWLLVYYSSAFIIFPGGIGTLDELTEVLNLIKTKQISEIPIVLIDSYYWKPFIDWIRIAMSEGLLLPGLDNQFIVTNSVDEAYDNITKYFQKGK